MDLDRAISAHMILGKPLKETSSSPADDYGLLVIRMVALIFVAHELGPQETLHGVTENSIDLINRHSFESITNPFTFIYIGKKQVDDAFHSKLAELDEWLAKDKTQLAQTDQKDETIKGGGKETSLSYTVGASTNDQKKLSKILHLACEEGPCIKIPILSARNHPLQLFILLARRLAGSAVKEIGFSKRGVRWILDFSNGIASWQ